MDLNLKNKKVLVTGGCQGIGLACVKAFLNEQSKVIMVDKDYKKGEKLCKEFRNKGNDVNFFSVDLSDEQSIFKMLNFIEREYNYVDICINNAGVTAASLIVSDGGAIGSASDTDAMEIASGGNVTFTKQPDIAGDFIVLNGTDVSSSNAGDNIIIEDGGTDGSGTNAGSSLLYEFGTSFTSAQLLIKDSNGVILNVVNGIG